jgi:hypothetical protein
MIAIGSGTKRVTDGLVRSCDAKEDQIEAMRRRRRNGAEKHNVDTTTMQIGRKKGTQKKKTTSNYDCKNGAI